MIEIIAYYGIAGALGLFIGWFSYRHQTVFVALAGSGMAALGVIIKVFSPLGKVAGVGFWEAVGMWFQSLPVNLQNAICISLFIAIGARIVTWWYRKFIWVETVETRAQMRERVYKLHSYQGDIVDAYADAPRQTANANSGQSLRSAAGLR